MRLSDILSALAFLTRIPVASHSTNSCISSESWAWPVAGALVGAAAGGLAWILSVASVPFGVVAFLSLLLIVLLTGALHEDGLADTADGLWGGNAPASRLAIMNDSRIGVFGATAVFLSLLGRWQGIEALGPTHILPALIASCAVSRSVMLMAMYKMPAAKKGGLAFAAGPPDSRVAVTGVALAAIIALSTVGWMALPLLAVSGLAAVPVCWLAHRKVGGVTGDILGAVQQCAELAAVLLLATVV